MNRKGEKTGQNGSLHRSEWRLWGVCGREQEATAVVEPRQIGAPDSPLLGFVFTSGDPVECVRMYPWFPVPPRIVPRCGRWTSALLRRTMVKTANPASAAMSDSDTYIRPALRESFSENALAILAK